ncbi:putative disease resistance protein At1g50180 [Elaeis guineensis]|uniref:putative disease resistance protein At1g50180 n=1 Tax=Elaeis guineensis var. tenera TaxID=51953 RepID=UPI003C6CFB99
MAESIVQSAAQTIGNLLVEEAKYLYAVSDQIKRLEEELEWMQLFLKDAAGRQHDDAVVRKWVSKIKEFAYEAEDILEKYILRVSLRRQDGFWNMLKWFSCIFRDAAALHEVGSDVDDLTQKISFLTSRMTTYGVNIRAGVSSSSSYAKRMELRRTFSHIVEEDDTVGLESDSKTLVDRLVNQECKIVAVSGMGGLGKTTLAKKVYHHPTIRRHFHAFSWVHVSQQFQTKNVLKEILLDLTPKTESGEGQRNRIKGLSESELPGEVYKVLKEEPYLVVLDDVWTQEDWKRLQPAFR